MNAPIRYQADALEQSERFSLRVRTGDMVDTMSPHTRQPRFRSIPPAIGDRQSSEPEVPDTSWVQVILQ